MKQLLIRADDLGYSDGVNCGIARSVSDGVVGSVGIMTNMPTAEEGVRMVRETGVDVALGQHTNLTNGFPAADPSLVPSLLGADGEFRTSREHHGAAEDLVDKSEAKIEIKAQLERFRQIVGHDPDYFENHVLLSPNFLEAMAEVAAEEGLKFCPLDMDGELIKNGNTMVRLIPMRSMLPDYDPAAWLREQVLAAPEGSTSVWVGHPGYVDGYLLAHSSLTTNRAREVDAYCDPELPEWLAAHDVRLVDYRDL